MSDGKLATRSASSCTTAPPPGSVLTWAGGGRGVTELSGGPAVKPCGHQEAVPAPQSALLARAWGRGLPRLLIGGEDQVRSAQPPL